MTTPDSTATIPAGYSVFRRDLDHIDDSLGPSVAGLAGARILVTGATGFFGIWLLEALLWLDERHGLGLSVTGLSRDPGRFLAGKAPHLAGRPQLQLVRGSLTDMPAAAGPFTHIIHAASETNVERSADFAARHLQAALEGTRRVLDIAARDGVAGLLVTTSGAVYGQPDRVVAQRCQEGYGSLADYTGERNVYGEAKRMMELMTAVAAGTHGFRAVIARPFAFVGPYLPLEANYAIGNFIRDALAGRTVAVGGDGTALRSYLYAADLAAWLLVLLLRGRTGVPYNVGGQEAVSIGDLARLVASVAGQPGAVAIRGTAVPGAVPNAYLPNLSRARDELGLTARIALPDAIGRTLAWHRHRGRDAAVRVQPGTPTAPAPL